jgi:hypothetical protein
MFNNAHQIFMYKRSKTIRNLLYVSKFNKNKTIFYHLWVTLVPVLLMMCISHTSHLNLCTGLMGLPCGWGGDSGREHVASLFLKNTSIDDSASLFPILNTEGPNDWWVHLGLQAGTESSFSEINQKNSGVLAVGVPGRRTVSSHIPPVNTAAGLQLAEE